MKMSLEDNVIEIDSTHNEGKHVLLKDLLEPLRTNFVSIWPQNLKMCTSIT